MAQIRSGGAGRRQALQDFLLGLGLVERYLVLGLVERYLGLGLVERY